MIVSELEKYKLPADKKGNVLNPFDFTLTKGDVCSIQTDSLDNARLFIKALATHVHPVAGTYRFKGETLDFQDYQKLLDCKKMTGYIAADAAMISNRTVRENLLFRRYYFENSLSLELDERTEQLCRDFGLSDLLDIPVAEIDLVNRRAAITLREITKPLEMLLVERPEDYIGHSKFNSFMEVINDIVLSGTPVVFLSYLSGFVDRFSNRAIQIDKGDLTTTSN